MAPVPFGRILILIGMIVAAVGVLAWSGALNWFGRLPGDIRIDRPDLQIRIPWVSLILVSAVFNLLVWACRSLLR